MTIRVPSSGGSSSREETAGKGSHFEHRRSTERVATTPAGRGASAISRSRLQSSGCLIERNAFFGKCIDYILVFLYGDGFLRGKVIPESLVNSDSHGHNSQRVPGLHLIAREIKAKSGRFQQEDVYQQVL